MKLVVNTNILFSFFRENPVRELIIVAPMFSLDLFVPEYAFSEIEGIKDEVIKYAKICNTDFAFLFGLLRGLVKTILSLDFDDFRIEAKKVSPDLKDAPFFALAMKLDAWIWSNDLKLKNQDKIKIFSTKDLRMFLGLI